jgi:hypothetical protein
MAVDSADTSTTGRSDVSIKEKLDLTGLRVSSKKASVGYDT